MEALLECNKGNLPVKLEGDIDKALLKIAEAYDLGREPYTSQNYALCLTRRELRSREPGLLDEILGREGAGRLWRSPSGTRGATAGT